MPPRKRRGTSRASTIRKRFNGAATLPPRKRPTPMIEPESSLGFNGAATLPPRKRVVRKIVVERHQLASTEPRRCRRGNSALCAPTGANSSRFNGAATLPPRKPCRRARTPGKGARFNGAATLPPRKLTISCAVATPAVGLQRSRDVAAAETAPCGRRTPGASGASTEPRRCRRGNPWCTRADWRECRRFNGAATLPPRKRRPCFRPTTTRTSFNGAATLPPRKRFATIGATRFSSGFNGAATLPPRKPPSRTMRGTS